MSPKQAWIRGNNLLAVSVVALSGLAFLPEIIFEDEWQHKLDEGLLFLLAVRAVIWYKSGENRFTHSIMPVFFVLAALIIKIGGLILEFKDKEDVGDDFGALILFLISTLLVFWLYKKANMLKNT